MVGIRTAAGGVLHLPLAALALELVVRHPGKDCVEQQEGRKHAHVQEGQRRCWRWSDARESRRRRCAAAGKAATERGDAET